MKTKVVLVGVGFVFYILSCAQSHAIFRGATCSGKTTLAKQLRTILPDSVIIHQDVCYSCTVIAP